MLVAGCIHGKRYTIREFLAATLLCTGAACYGFESGKTGAGFDNRIEGIIMLISSICCDALVPNLQQYLMADGKTSAEEVTFYSNILGVVCIICWMLLTGDLWLMLSNPNFSGAFCLHLMMIGVCLGVAVTAYTYIIKESGSVTAVAVSTFRKVATMLLSYLVFPKELTALHMVGSVSVVLGIIVEGMK